jgi:prepilin-type N-terminal cleavage/methylation domain-containing protein
MGGKLRHGFTLVELLVVITIIVVLLAMLTPALDQAIYQAELATCAARQKLVASAVATYALEFKRSYPYRAGVQDSAFTWWTHFFTVPPQSAQGKIFDDRPQLRPYLSINALNDPLTPMEVDFDAPEAAQGSTLPTTLWAGFKYNSGGGLVRLGDRLRFPATVAGEPEFVSTIIYSDMMMATIAFGGVIDSAHADSNSVLAPYNGSDGSSSGDGAAGGLAAGVIEGAVFSRWRVVGWGGVGTIDMNFAHTDGSVDRLMKVDYRAMNRDTRVERIGVAQSSSDNPSEVTGTWNTLPPK